MYYVYVIKGELGRLYVGMTSDLKRRFLEHQRGGVWTTKRMGNLELIFYEAFKSKLDAARREKYFKTSKGKISLKQVIRESLL
ncbi:MAG: GIY-YIG nuclease family protein [Patescibacteria group bacterium]